MKKIYNAPQVNETIITIDSMICASGDLQKEGNAAASGITTADSRLNGYNVWGDEEDEEY